MSSILCLTWLHGSCKGGMLRCCTTWRKQKEKVHKKKIFFICIHLFGIAASIGLLEHNHWPHILFIFLKKKPRSSDHLLFASPKPFPALSSISCICFLYFNGPCYNKKQAANVLIVNYGFLIINRSACLKLHSHLGCSQYTALHVMKWLCTCLQIIAIVELHSAELVIYLVNISPWVKKMKWDLCIFIGSVTQHEVLQTNTSCITCCTDHMVDKLLWCKISKLEPLAYF